MRYYDSSQEVLLSDPSSVPAVTFHRQVLVELGVFVRMWYGSECRMIKRTIADRNDLLLYSFRDDPS